jgi:hypothetical protein
MKTLDNFKNEVSVKYGHNSFAAFKNKCIKDNAAHSILDMISLSDEASILHSKYIQEETIKGCADAATLWVETPINGTEFTEIQDNLGDKESPFIQKVTVFKESILNIERILK